FVIGGAPGQFNHATQDLRPMLCRIVARRDVKAEDPYAGSLIKLGELHRPLETLQVGVERLGNPNFSNRRTDRAQSDLALGEERAKCRVLVIGQIQNIGAVDRAELDVLDVVLGKHLELLDRVLGDFVGEGAEVNHQRKSWNDIASVSYLQPPFEAES